MRRRAPLESGAADDVDDIVCSDATEVSGMLDVNREMVLSEVMDDAVETDGELLLFALALN